MLYVDAKIKSFAKTFSDRFFIRWCRIFENKNRKTSTNRPICLNENGAQTTICGNAVVYLTTKTLVGTPRRNTPALCMHTLVPSMQYLLPWDSFMKSEKLAFFHTSRRFFANLYMYEKDYLLPGRGRGCLIFYPHKYFET